MWDWDWWRTPDADRVSQRLARKASAGDIIVIHDGHHKSPEVDRRHAAETVRQLVPVLRRRGFAFAPLCGAGQLELEADTAGEESRETRGRPDPRPAPCTAADRHAMPHGKLASHGIVVLRENEEMTVEYLGAVGQAVGRTRSAAACPLGG